MIDRRSPTSRALTAALLSAAIAGCSDFGDPVSLPRVPTGAPLAEIQSIVPPRTVAGDTVRVVGTGFGDMPGSTSVRFASVSGGTDAEVLSWSDGEVVVVVPDDAISGDLVAADGDRLGAPAFFDVAPAIVSFQTDLGPIFQRQGCRSCHFDRATGTNGFSVATVADILAGGDHGPAAVPRRTEESLLSQVVRGTALDVPRMPYLGNPMPESEILLIEDWIHQGMRDN